MSIDHFIPFSPPLIEQDEIDEVCDTLRSGWLTTGPKTQQFEGNFAEYVGAKAAVATSSCTAALHLSLKAMNVGEGDAVITTPFTFASTAHVILYQDASPIFVDIEERTMNIDPDAVERYLKSCRYAPGDDKPVDTATGKRVVGIMPVHYAGRPCDMDRLTELARNYNLFVVEDAAHAAGTVYRGKKIGGSGNLACFSFYATKNLATGEGGMITTDDVEMAERLRCMTMYGISDARAIWKRYTPKGTWDYDIQFLGLKCNFSDLQACLGLHQLRKLDSFIATRQRYAAIYDRAFSGLPGVSTPASCEDGRHAWHLYPLLVDPAYYRIDRTALIERLRERNIGTSVLFKPLHLHSFYRDALGLLPGAFPKSESVFNRLINLPVSPKLPESDIGYVAETVAEILNRERV